MTEETYRYFDLLFKLLTTVAAIFAFYQLREVIRKRHIDMYWKIAEIYYSDEQREARRNINEIEKFVIALKKESIPADEIIKRYNQEYHCTDYSENKNIDSSIINRIRFLNQTGVLLKKKLIDEDLLFGLIGAGFEIDYPILNIVLDAHRNEHQMPKMYAEMNSAWNEYNEWKNRHIANP